MGRVVRAKARLGLSLEIGTPAVPDDGRYHVLADGRVVYSTGVLAAAEVQFEELVAQRSSLARDHLAREQAHYNIQAVRSDSFERRAAKARKTGGRGGRGGV